MTPNELAQKAICQKYKSAYKPLKENAEVALALSTIGTMPIYGSRIDSDDNGVEWYIYCGEFSEAENFYEPVAADCLKDELPLVVSLMALEVGYNFIVDDQGYVDVWKTGEE